jgi:hypothetical protein
MVSIPVASEMPIDVLDPFRHDLVKRFADEAFHNVVAEDLGIDVLFDEFVTDRENLVFHQGPILPTHLLRGSVQHDDIQYAEAIEVDLCSWCVLLLFSVLLHT